MTAPCVRRSASRTDETQAREAVMELTERVSVLEAEKAAADSEAQALYTRAGVVKDFFAWLSAPASEQGFIDSVN